MFTGHSKIREDSTLKLGVGTLTENMITSAQEFHRLMTSDLPAEYHRAAHDEAPLAVWREIIASMPEMREWVAHNKTVPHEILEELSHDPDDRVRDTVARKRKISEAIQLRLATDPSPEVRSALAHNAKATRRVLEILAQNPNERAGEKAIQRLQESP